MTDLAIETNGLVGGYGRDLVLRQVSLRVPKGSVYGFLGPNGAGKTTLMRILVGLLRPLSGEVRLFGEPIPAALPKILRRVGALIEQPSLYDHLTGTENLEIAAKLKGCGRAEVGRATETLSIGKFVEHRAFEYSRGMRQRLGVAMAMLGDPELLLLDEPMNGMDSNGLRAFRSLLESISRERGTTILLSSHQFEEVEQVATHIGIMSESGDLLFQGTREELSDRVPQRLIVKVVERDQAFALLTDAGYAVDLNRDELIIAKAAPEMARDVNRLLVSAGVNVQHLEVESATLEALFSKITTTVKAWDGQ